MDITFIIKVILLLLGLVVVIVSPLYYFRNSNQPLSHPIINLKIIDMAIILIVMGCYSLLSFYHLGSMQQYSTWYGVSEQKTITINFFSPKNISDVDIYALSISGKLSVSYIDESGRFSLLSSVDTLKNESMPTVNWQEFKFNPQTRYKTIFIRCDRPIVEIKKIIIRDNKLNLIHDFAASANTTPGLDSMNGLFHLTSLSSSPDYRDFSMYYDEPFYALTGAAAYLYPIFARNPAQPALGNWLISGGIALFGINPFGWRFMANFAGVLLLPLLYIFALQLFRNRYVAIVASLLCFVDFLHFSLGRVAILDNFAQLFTLLIYIFLYRYCWLREKFKNIAYNNLIYMVICFSLGVACKWTTAFSLCAIVLLVCYYELKANNFRKIATDFYLLTTCSVLIFFFIYILSYIPLLVSLSQANIFSSVYSATKTIYRLQMHEFLQDGSMSGIKTFWMWPLNLNPLIIYSWHDDVLNLAARIILMGNPLVWWSGLVAVIYLVYKIVIAQAARVDKFIAGFILIGFLAQYLPFMLVSRECFIYYFYGATLFLYLALDYVINDLLKLNNRIFKLILLGYLVATVVCFISFYPIISGEVVDKVIIKQLMWLPTWKF